ncbi:MAG: aminoacyl-tRNA hydrolase [Candidatus Pacebacteria bacterium]|nr:aminoacyl-tRNA hydrolase [Candidatus Paceibacterota bacterium]
MLNVVGLGNPGEEYAENRHNAGRIILELIAKKNDFTDWRDDKKTRALFATGKLGTKKFQFVLPNNFMNNSGGSVKPLVKSKKDLEDLVVVYDDLDIPMGSMKISFNKSSGGHNGVESIIKSVKSQQFVRIRVGISPHTASGKMKKPSGEKPVLDFLLKDFKEAEFAELKKLSKKITLALECYATDGKDKMMSLYN